MCDIESEDCVIIGGRLTYFEISSGAIDLVDGAQCNVNVNLDLCFTLSCELVRRLTISKSQALEIVYCAHARAVEGVVDEVESVS